MNICPSLFLLMVSSKTNFLVLCRRRRPLFARTHGWVIWRLGHTNMNTGSSFSLWIMTKWSSNLKIVIIPPICGVTLHNLILWYVFTHSVRDCDHDWFHIRFSKPSCHSVDAIQLAKLSTAIGACSPPPPSPSSRVSLSHRAFFGQGGGRQNYR